jgi:Tfp pilus assembly PilM family ATPase
MQALSSLWERFRPKPADVVGIDLGSSATKVVRMQKHGDSLTLVAADVLPPVAQPAAESSPPLGIPARLKGRYGCLALTAEKAVVKLLTFPGAFDEKAEGRVVESMGMEHPENYRTAYKVIAEGHARGESRVLAVAVPEEEARPCPLLLASGFPVPFSLEVSGLAALSAFLHTCGESDRDHAVGVIEFGASVSTLGLFNRGLLSLIRRFNFGTSDLLGKVREKMGVDEDTARGIVTDGSFDISQAVNEVLEPLVKQLIVSRDFVERRENCRIARVYVSGGLTVSSSALDEIRTLMEVEVLPWNPLGSVNVPGGAIPAGLAGNEWQLAAAVGACVATFEAS